MHIDTDPQHGTDAGICGGTDSSPAVVLARVSSVSPFCNPWASFQVLGQLYSWRNHRSLFDGKTGLQSLYKNIVSDH